MGAIFLSGDATNGQIAATTNDVIREQQASQITQVFKDDTGTRRVLLGKGADGFYGLKVSEEGTDVYSAGDSELIFNSNNNVFKIVDEGTVILPDVSAGSSQMVSYTHNLGFIPAVVSFVDIGGFAFPIPYLNITGTAPITIDHAVTISLLSESTITFTIVQATASVATLGNLPVKFYLLQETAN